MITFKTATPRRPTLAKLSEGRSSFLESDYIIQEQITKVIAALPRPQAEKTIDEMLAGFDRPRATLTADGKALYRKMGRRYRTLARQQLARGDRGANHV